MEGGLRHDVPPRSRDHDGGSERTCTASSSVTVERPNRECFQRENATVDRCTEWTDEKHNSYISYLEASFVNQLHRSRDRKKLMDPNLIKQNHLSTLSTPHKFTVHQDGCWQKFGPKRSCSRLQIRDSCSFLGRRFKLSDMKDCDINCLNGKSCGVATMSEKLPVSQLQHRVSVGCITEVSDQNFVDGEAGDACAAKWVKMAATEDLQEDQVVPDCLL